MTGGDSGIGAACGIALAQLGTDVAPLVHERRVVFHACRHS